MAAFDIVKHCTRYHNYFARGDGGKSFSEEFAEKQPQHADEWRIIIPDMVASYSGVTCKGYPICDGGKMCCIGYEEMCKILLDSETETLS